MSTIKDLIECQKEMNQLELAVSIAKRVNSALEGTDMHIGLTGGVLYKEGTRKDIDFVIYRSKWTGRTFNENEAQILYLALNKAELFVRANYGRVMKAVTREGTELDFIIPESDIGQY